MPTPHITYVDLLFLLASAGTAIFVGSILWIMLSDLTYSKLAKRLNRIPPKKAKKKEKDEDRLFDKPTLFNGGIVIVFFATFLWDTPYIFAVPAIGMSIGMIISKVSKYFKTKADYMIRLKETIRLYDLVEFYTFAKYTIPQALVLAKDLTPSIKPAVERCINQWSFGPQKAIEQMGKDINVKECDIMISVLNQAVTLGTQRLSGVLGEEAGKLEDLRHGKVEAGINLKPLYQAVYLILPGIGFLGMFLFPLAYRVIVNFAQLNAGGGNFVVN